MKQGPLLLLGALALVGGVVWFATSRPSPSPSPARSGDPALASSKTADPKPAATPESALDGGGQQHVELEPVNGADPKKAAAPAGRAPAPTPNAPPEPPKLSEITGAPVKPADGGEFQQKYAGQSTEELRAARERLDQAVTNFNQTGNIGHDKEALATFQMLKAELVWLDARLEDN